MKGKLNLIFDWRVMGVNAYIPFIVVLVLISYSKMKQDALTHIIPALELTFPAFAAWWSIFLFQDVLEEPGSETLFSYPIKRWKLGLARVGFFFIIYIILMLIMLFIIDQWSVTEDILLPLAIQLGTQSFFFAGLGFLSMVLFSKSGWALVILVVYTSTQVLTRGTLIPIVNIFIFNQGVLPISELWGPALFSVLMGTVFWALAHMLFAKIRHFV